ncbi:hypothetical protein HDV00_000820 [Rhizophlyctis rosea]|nr:hypothetical protein HDV00_000820 [Rhizophlyctis rosea]
MLGGSKRVGSSEILTITGLSPPHNDRLKRPLSPSLEDVLKAIPFSTQNSAIDPIVPPWLPVLKDSIRSNEEEKFASLVQLATLRPDGRPQNQSFQFRGFDPSKIGLPQDENQPTESNTIFDTTPRPSSAPASLEPTTPTSADASYFVPLPVQSASSSPPLKLTNSLTLGKLASLFTFTCDIRLISRSILSTPNPKSEGIDKIVITEEGARAEACWCMPRTDEQYRLCGQLYFIGAPDAMDATSVPPPWGPKDWGFWESARQRVWDSLSPAERKTFEERVGSAPTVSEEVPGCANCGYSNFGLLLLDVDTVEHTVMGGEWLIPVLRMRYHVVVPKRTYGRITGLHWQVEGTRFE